ncbi:uncharacterized protein LOC128230972 [Mya arenaria]|uniref:uncharacterized protein LOC128230972 n=1 Tax=Mya arenaria TaxID=6604 RepID=UPI0022DF4D53|nr:uncharacterized protein LOC128230972 [Mya arenaria]
MTSVYEHQIVAAHEACFKSMVDMNGLDRCLEHKRVFMFHCENHKDLCCEICAFSRHRRCEKIHEIAKVAKKVKDDEREKIRASINTASEVIMKCNEAQLNNVSRVKEIVKEIDVYKETLLKKIEEAKSGIVIAMTNHNTQKDERLDTRRNVAENLKKDLDKHLAMSESIHKNGTESEIFILNHILEKTLDKASQTLNTLLKKDYTVKGKLTINENGLKRKTTDVALFSLMGTRRQKTQSVNGNKEIKTTKSSEIVNNVQQRPLRLELLKTLKLENTGDDKELPFVTGLDFLPNKRIFAVDDCNCTCFILDDTLKRFDAFYKFTANPRDVTSYSDNNIAVTVSARAIRTICLLTVGSNNTITLMKTLNTSTYCFSICPLNDHTFVVSTREDTRPAKMIDADGEERNFDNVMFSSNKYKIGESKCTYIPSHDSLVLTDRYSHTVYMYNTKTGKSTEVNHDRIRKPRGACVGPDDSVIICSNGTNSIVQVSSVGEIMSSCGVEMNYPYAVAISKDRSLMAVTNDPGGVRKLQLFKIIR